MISAGNAAQTIGRNVERAFLQKQVSEAEAGRGSIVVITGHAGIGKSHLVTDAIDVAGSKVRSTTALCLEHARSPLAPILDALDDLEGAGIGELRDPDATRFPASEGHRYLYRALAERFRACGNRAPIFVAIEDLQWADAETLAFLTFLGTKVAGLRATFALTARTTDRIEDEFTRRLAAIVRSPFAKSLRLTSLSDQALVEFIGMMLGEIKIDAAARRAIRIRSDGNPLFAAELVRQSCKSSGTLPESLKQSVLDRAELLDPDHRRILELGAVLGRRFSETVLVSLVSNSTASVNEALRSARDHRMIVEEPRTTSWSFVHALLQEFLLEAIPSSELRRLHGVVAKRLEESTADATVGELAFHWAAAGEVERASRYQEAAGDAALKVGASVEAADFYRSLAEVKSEPADTLRILEKFGTALGFSGLPDLSAAELQRALDIARSLDDAAATSRIALNLSRMTGHSKSCRASVPYLEGVLPALANSPRAAAPVLASLAFVHATLGDTIAAARYSRELEKDFDHLETPVLLELLDARGTYHAYEGSIEASLTAYAAAAELAKTMQYSRWTIRAPGNRAIFAASLGRTSLAVESASDTVGVLGPAAGSLRPFMLAVAARTQMRAGNTGVATAMLREAETFAFDTDFPRLEYQLAVCAFSLAARTGQHDLVERHDIEGVVDAAFASGEPMWICDVVAAVGEWLAVSDNAPRLSAFIERACGLARTAVLSYEFVLLIAMYGSDVQRAWVRTSLEAWRSKAGDPFVAALLSVADTRYQEAAEGFAALRIPYAEAVANELAGHLERAASAYRRAGAQTHVSRIAANSDRTLDPLDKLSKREREVAALLLQGSSNRAIAAELSLSERTIEVHLRSIYAKCRVSGRLELAALVLGRPPSAEA